MNTIPKNPAVQGLAANQAPKRRWRNRAIAAATGTALLGAAVFGATAASAANTSPSPSAGTSLAGTSSAASTNVASTSTSSASASAASGAAKHTAKHPFAQLARQELRIDIQGKSGFGDNAHEVAYLLIHHKAAFGKLPANLQNDLKTLEGAAAADRDADAGKIKDTALNGGYGDKIQKEAKTIQTNLAKAPATTAPATPKS